MGSVVRNYVWCLNDVDLCLTSGNFCANSPTFSIGDSQCEFYLQFGFNEGVDQVSVFLCRREDDRGAPEVVVNFLLVLQSARDGHVDTYRSTFTFERGKSDGFNITKTRQDNFSNRDPLLHVGDQDDAFVVKCETFNPSPTFDHTSTDIDVLSEDLLKLHASGVFANAHLVAGDCSIPVHKEVLAARSEVLERKFETTVCGKLETPFPAPVVKAVLAFAYSANIARVDFRDTSLEQVLNCARYYGISDLVDMLTPNVTYFTTTVEHKTETHMLRFDCFKLLKSTARAEHHPVRMKFDNDIEMVATLFRDPYIKSGDKTDVEISLKNLCDIKSVRVRVYLQDYFGAQWRPLTGERTLEPDARGIASWRFEHQFEDKKNSVHPDYTLRLWCEAKFRLSDPFSVSDPDFFGGSGGYEALCVETSRAFVRSMERLMESASLADTHLVLSSADKFIRVPVHRSVLAARSPLLRTLLEAGIEVKLDLPKEVGTALMRYIYTGNLVASRPEAVCMLHGTASTYGMDQLRIACKGVAVKMPLDLKNVYSVYLIAVRENDRVLQKSCKDFIVENKDIVFGSFRWENFRKRHGKASDDIKKYVVEKKWISVK